MLSLPSLKIIIPFILRSISYTFLVLQIVLAFAMTIFMTGIAGFELHRPDGPSPGYSWIYAISFGLAVAASCIILRGFYKRTAWTQCRRRVLAAALTNIALCCLHILYGAEGYTPSDFFSVNNPPLTINVCILIILKAKPLYRYIFDFRK